MVTYNIKNSVSVWLSVTPLKETDQMVVYNIENSAAKPVQAVAVIETGAMEKYGFDDVDLALICGHASRLVQHHGCGLPELTDRHT